MPPIKKTAIVCVIDTECCFKNTKADKMIFHFGACIGNVHQEHSFDVVKMDYYVKEVLEEFEHLKLSKNIIRERISFRKAARGGLSVAELSKQDPKATTEILDVYKEIFNV